MGISSSIEHYYSGHRHHHAIHSQVVIDNTGEIRHIECGFLGHQNDAQQFRLMRQIGQDLPFPQNYNYLTVNGMMMPMSRIIVLLRFNHRTIDFG
jgi:hypothetical protein